MARPFEEHPGVKVVGGILVAVITVAFGFYVWVSEGHHERDEAWDTVPIGAVCPDLGAEERTYDGRAVYCSPFPTYGIQVWSRFKADVGQPVPAAADQRDAQVRVCMHQARLDQRNCEAGIAQYEGGADTR